MWFGGGGREERVYFGVHAEASFGENALLEWHFAQKRQVKDSDHLIHAIEVGRERKPSILIHSGKLERVRGRNKTKEFCPKIRNGEASTL